MIACQMGIHYELPGENDAPIADALHQALGYDYRCVLSLRKNTCNVLSPCYSCSKGKQQEG
jgi:hypothetical protein